MSLSKMKSWIWCLALVILVVANQVQVGAAGNIDPAVPDPCKLSGAAQDKDANGLPGIPYLSTAQTKATVSSGRSGSSRDQSEDDDATTDNTDPADMKMAEESIKRIVGLKPMFHVVMLELYTMKDGAVPLHDDPNHHFFQPLLDDPLSTLDPIVNNGMADISSSEKVQPNSEATAVAGNKIG
ncbi:hypothetical protein LWI28_013848 [Acer negundo]|uniref:Basic leucine-zipper C-terminal domain-containing protein n=1 Tax=Acer negundo TaxID=4023 RepID=A0AAD5P477_ACENE|nr:hypothetical protein LWI28_013848 [Acer negundo]